jgi:hypothetical protein
VPPCGCGGGGEYPCPAPLGPYTGRSGGVAGAWRAGRAGLTAAENVGATRSDGLAAVNVGPGFWAGVGSAGLGAAAGAGADGVARATGIATCVGW